MLFYLLFLDDRLPLIAILKVNTRYLGNLRAAFILRSILYTVFAFFMSEYELNKQGEDVVSMLGFVLFCSSFCFFQVAINLYSFMLWLVFCVNLVPRAQFLLAEERRALAQSIVFPTNRGDPVFLRMCRTFQHGGHGTE